MNGLNSLLMELDFIGVIEDGYWGDTPSTSQVKGALDSGSGEEITLNIASEGGSVFEAFKIAALISNYKGKTVANGFGLVASAATLIMAACDDAKMTKGSFYMIHNSWTFAAGNKEQLEQEADLMGKIDDMMAEIYTNCIDKNGKLIEGNRDKTKKEVKKMMKAETWLTAQEALDFGLVNSIMEKEQPKEVTMQAQAFGRIRAQASNFKHIPNEILNKTDMSTDKKSLFAKILGAFGFTSEDVKAELEAIEAPATPEAKEVEAPATETPEASTDTSAENEEITALKNELAEMKLKNEQMQASITSLEIKAKSKLPVTNEPKDETNKTTAVITAEMESEMNSYVKKAFGK